MLVLLLLLLRIRVRMLQMHLKVFGLRHKKCRRFAYSEKEPQKTETLTHREGCHTYKKALPGASLPPDKRMFLLPLHCLINLIEI